LNPDLWRERIKPFTAKLITPFKEMGFKTMYHSDGAIVPVIDDLIEIGLDFLDPVQTKATGMTPEELYPRFGQRLSFHGAIDEVELLNHATAEEVYAETTRVIDILGQQGGLIVSATHVVQGDVPPENIVAMIKATQAYRWSDDE
jgi:uroporphyrinogen decarboxylase